LEVLVQRFDDPVGSVKVRADEQFAIALAGNPTTGYEWQASVDPKYIESGTREFEPRGMAPGAGGREVLHFRARQAGETEIAFEYRRAWEQEPVDVRRLKLLIAD
jgi:predicted secreted protein